MPLMRVPPPLAVPDQDADVLRTWVDDAASETAARRARIVLLSGEGLGPTAISDELRCSKQTVITWRERYRAAGMAGLRDAPRPGRPATVCPETVVRRTLHAPPGSTRRWTTRTLGVELGVSNASVGQVWRTWGVTPAGPGRVSLATEPPFDGRIAAIAGVHIGPSLRILAVLPGEPDPAFSGTGPDLGALLPGDAGEGQDTGPEEFLRRIRPEGAVLIADRDLGRALHGALYAPGPVHTVPQDLSWERVVRVACWIAGRSGPGAESVAALHTALCAHPRGAALSWTYS